MDGYELALLIYVALALGTFIPVAVALLRPVQQLFVSGPTFGESTRFSDEAKERLSQHYARLQGTLKFWKNQVTKYRRFHTYSLVWVTISTVSVPFLAQAITSNPWSRWLITVMGAHAALCLALARTFRVEANFKAFRHGESEFYDLYRRMLDRPESLGRNESRQMTTYFEQVEVLRRYIRGAETDNLPSIEELAQESRPGSKDLGPDSQAKGDPSLGTPSRQHPGGQ